MSVPAPWAFVLLALAAFRVYRLLARDTITEPARAAVSYPDDEAVTLDRRPDRIEVVGEYSLPKPLRVYIATLIRCAWCAGFYVSVAWWVAWLLEPRWTLIVAAPLAVASVLALVEKNLDA